MSLDIGAVISSTDADEADDRKVYKVRPGTIDFGRDYEIKIAALLALRCCVEDLQHFWLATNVDNCGYFDDIVLYTKTKNAEDTVYFMQLKHQDLPRNITTKEFLSKKGNFLLEKLSSYCKESKREIFENVENNRFFLDIEQAYKIKLILFTNRKVEENCSLLLVLDNTADLDIVKIKGKVFTVDTPSSEEFPDFFLFTDQPHCKDVDKEIKNVLKKIIKSSILSEAKLKEVCEQFVYFITNWSRGDLNEHYALTKTEVLQKLAELLLLPYTVRLEHSIDFTNFNYNLWNDLIGSKEVTVIDRVDDIIEPYVKGAIQDVINREGIQKTVTLKNTKMYRGRRDRPSKMTNNDVYELLWKAGKVPLLVEIRDLQDVNSIQEILKLIQGILRIIIFNKTEGCIKNLNSLRFFCGMDDLSVHHQKEVLQYPIKLQNRLLSSFAELEINEETIFKYLKVGNIVHILSGTFEICSKFEPFPEAFVKPSLASVWLETDVLQKVREDIFAIKCDVAFTLKKFLQYDLDIDENEIGYWEGDTRSFSFRIVIFEAIRSLREIEGYYSTLGKTVHFLIWHDNNSLEWNMSNKTIANIRLFRKSSLTVESEALVNFYETRKSILVSANPGMGKTFLIDFLATHASTNLWVLKVSLAAHSESYSRWNVQDQISSNQLKEFVSEIAAEQTGNNELVQTVFEKYFESKRILLLLDGFDEIPVRFQNGARNLIKFIDTSGYFMCLTTRPVLKNDLEALLDTFALSLKPFTKQEQTYFLTKCFAKGLQISPSGEQLGNFVGRLLDAINVNLKDSNGDFSGIPLHTSLLAEMFIHDCKQYLTSEIFDDKYLDLLRLCKYFAEKKIQIACSKTEPVSRDTLDLHKMHRSFCALQSLFCPDDLSVLELESELRNLFRSSRYALQMLQKDGIIVAETELDINFVHRLFAEFEAARWLAENFHGKHKKTVEILIRKSFNPNLMVVRNIFDRMLSSDLPLHSAVIDHRVNMVKDIIDFDVEACERVDAGKRTFLHLVAAWGLHHPRVDENGNSISQKMANEDDMLLILKSVPSNKLSHSKDDVLGYTPLEYAIASGSLNVANGLCAAMQDVGQNPCIDTSDATYISKYCKQFHYKFLFGGLSNAHSEEHQEVVASNTETNDSDRHLLHDVIKTGDIDKIYAIVSSVTNIDVTDSDGCTALLLAVKQGFIQISQILLSQKASVDAKDNEGKTSLHWASLLGHTDLVSLLLAHRTDKEAVDYYKRTALHFATQNGHTDIVRLLLVGGANIEAKDTTGWTALHHAVFNNYTKVMELLLSKEARTEAKDNENMSPLHWAANKGHLKAASLLLSKKVNLEAVTQSDKTPLILAASNGHAEVVTLLLSSGANVHAKDVEGKNALHWSIRNGHAKAEKILLAASENKPDPTSLILAARTGDIELLQLILSKNVNVETPDGRGMTALHWAALKGHLEALQLLMPKMSDLNLRDGCGRTPLIMAAGNGHTDVANLLLEEGADAELPDDKHMTPLHWADHEGVAKLLLDKRVNVDAIDRQGRTPLMLAIHKNRVALVELLLFSRANIEEEDGNRMRPLHLATQKGYLDIVNLLLSKGADARAQGLYDWTPLIIATFENHKTVVATLLSLGVDMEDQDEAAYTALHWASCKGHTDVVNLLLCKGANLEKRTENDRTALMLAAERGHTAIVDLLLLRKANLEAEDGEGMSALRLASFNGQSAVADVLILKGANMENTTKNGRTALILAAKQGFNDTVKLLLSRGALIEARDCEQKTALIWAALQGHRDTVELLLEMGASKNAVDIFGKTPLILAAQIGYVDVVRLLLSRGSEAEVKDAAGIDAWTWSMIYGHKHVAVVFGSQKHFDKTPLMCSVIKGDRDEVKSLLSEGANTEEQDEEGMTALHWAVLLGYTDIVEMLAPKTLLEMRQTSGKTALIIAAEQERGVILDLLLRNGAAADATDDVYRSALHWAALKRNVNLTKMLLSRTDTLNEKDLDERTPLIYAAMKGSTSIVEMLLSKGADTQAVDRENLTALEWAKRRNHASVVSLLKPKKGRKGFWRLLQ